ncbi:MAG: TIGR02147 family protein [Bdellovibrionales bacterium]|nr:TIGR02147 family protein [Bdellovibrionales bacterium]
MESPREFLTRIFAQRKKKNPRYSTHALARDLGISQGYVSLLLTGKRSINVRQAAQFSVVLGLSSEETQALIVAAILDQDSTSKSKDVLKKAALPIIPKPVQIEEIDPDRFQMISQWYHLAILDLSTTVTFRSDPAWIARRLGLEIKQVQDALDRLVRVDFLRLEKGQYIKTSQHIQLDPRQSLKAVRAFHREMIGKAQDELKKESANDYSLRQISGTTLAISPTRLSAAKKKIMKFQKEMAELLTPDDCHEVYQLNVQLFPLTVSESRE